MAPPMRIWSAVLIRLPIALELVLDLRPAEHHHVRPPDVAGQPAQGGDLGLDQVAGRAGQAQGDVVHAGVLAVHRAETIRHVLLGQLGQPVGEKATVQVVGAGFTLVEPQVLQHDQAAGAQRRDRSVR